MSDRDDLLETMRAMWGEIRIATELLSVAAAIRELRDVLRTRSPR